MCASVRMHFLSAKSYEATKTAVIGVYLSGHPSMCHSKHFQTGETLRSEVKSGQSLP